MGYIFSVMHDCDHTRPCVNGTTDATCTLVLILICRLMMNCPMARHHSLIEILNGIMLMGDSTFESRDGGPVGGGFIWKSDHDLEGTF